MSLARGIDISQFQPNIDWSKVIQATGITFVIIRTGDGHFADTAFAQHWAEAKQAGLMRAAYHYLRQSVDAHQQAQLYLQALGDDPGELPPVADVEDTRVASPATYAATAQQWLQEVEGQLQRHPLVYTGGWWWNPNMLIAGHYPAWAPGYPLWVASYPLKSSVPSAVQLEQGQFSPIMPKSWSSWTIWQYSGDVAFLDGVTDSNGQPCHVDLDLFNGTADQLRALAGGTAAATATGPVVQPAQAQPAQLQPAQAQPAQSQPAQAQPAATSAGPAAGLNLPDPRVTNQIMINAFSHAFGTGYWDVALRAGLAEMADQRQAEYSGPAISALSNLSAAEQTALTQALAKIVSGS